MSAGGGKEGRPPGEQHAVDLGYTEGPVAMPDGRVLFTSMKGGIHSLLDRSVEPHAETGGGPTYFKIGRTVAYDIDCLDSWLDGKRRTSTSEPDEQAASLI